MKTPKELGINRKQFNNLLKLAKFLNNKRNLPKQVGFDMIHFHEQRENGDAMTKCGSVGCAVGFAPFAGINKKANESWITYSERVFTDKDQNGIIFDWLFGGDWKETDNTPKGAAKRIIFFLKNGVPRNYLEQKEGHAPLCYNTSHLVKK